METPSILVVDDDEDIRTMLGVVLQAEGYRVVSAADGLDALNVMRRDNPPALAVVDLMMPRMDGEHLIRSMQEDSALAQVPVAIMSGQPLGSTPSLHVSARLGKPVELEELMTVVHRLADRRR
jgi:chemosensory pili system protein ChpA (sensor histidine kinase/response regulator)